MRIKIKKLIKHIKRWNLWRKHSMDSVIHKLLVLFKIIDSPTFGAICAWKDYKEKSEAADEREQTENL